MTRSWLDQAKKAGQSAAGGGPDGTFAAGVARMTELLPVLMNDILSSAPEDHKVRSLDIVTSLHHSSLRSITNAASIVNNHSCVSLPIGENQEIARNLGAIKHLPHRNAVILQRQVKSASTKK